MRKFFCFFVFIAAFCFSGCKSAPVPTAEKKGFPPPLLVFNTIEAESPERMDLHFTLEIENPTAVDLTVGIDSWRVEMDEVKGQSGFDLENPTGGFTVNPGSASFPLKLSMDVGALSAAGMDPADNYTVKLVLELDVFNQGNAAPLRLEVSGLAVFPTVQTPVFSVTNIAILKAELINTRFRVGLKIDNPNPFPVDLSAFSYTLYGNGMLWAEGTERNIISVAGRTTIQEDIFLSMNFINMDRRLLDQIIRLEDVNYRFAGEAVVSTGVNYLPRFKSSFDLSGYSQVLEK